MVRDNAFDEVNDDAVSGAVRIWVETCMVVFRFFELIAGVFVKEGNNKNYT